MGESRSNCLHCRYLNAEYQKDWYEKSFFVTGRSVVGGKHFRSLKVLFAVLGGVYCGGKQHFWASEADSAVYLL